MLLHLSGPKCSSPNGESVAEKEEIEGNGIPALCSEWLWTKEEGKQWCAMEHPTQAITLTRTLAQVRPSRDDGQEECSAMCLKTPDCVLEQMSYIGVVFSH